MSKRVILNIFFEMKGRKTINEDSYQALLHQFKAINLVLTELVPGMKIELKVVSKIILKNGQDGYATEIVATRNGLEFPLRYESDGIKKIISILSLIISAYNSPSVTIAIDELDEGVFEYLLGEILKIFEDSGKGQLIFTSHNLRPLEVINKNFLYFTTTNPKNRYIHLKSIGNTNNLRSTYYREILLGGQDEEIYNSTKTTMIAAALREAGKNNG